MSFRNKETAMPQAGGLISAGKWHQPTAVLHSSVQSW